MVVFKYSDFEVFFIFLFFFFFDSKEKKRKLKFFFFSIIQIHDPEAEKCGVDDSHFHLLDDHLDSPGLLGFDLNKRVDTGCPTSQKALYVVLFRILNFFLIKASKSITR